MKIIQPDYNHYYALLFDNYHSTEHPIGFIGAQIGEDAPALTDIVTKASEWVSEGLEWGGKRRAVIYYWVDFEAPEVDMVLTADHGDERVVTFKLVEQEA